MSIVVSFTEVCNRLEKLFLEQSHLVHTEKWQGLDISKRPEAEMRELLHWSFSVPLRGIEDLEHWKNDIRPNLPFADVHFAERTSGIPSNPGEAWKIWPWGNSADSHRTEGGKFTHTYQERFWPKYAGRPQVSHDGSCGPESSCDADCVAAAYSNHGIRYPYGDLNDVVALLHREPLTRQAYLPIWFPEDTGAVHGGRLPCSLGYHFLLRHDYLHVEYGIRSCDFIRHFRDDCYFTVRLVLWILERLRELDERWQPVKPGLFKMNIGSLHMFVNDYHALQRKNTPGKPFKNIYDGK